MTFNLNTFWRDVRQYQGKLVKKNNENRIKYNVTVTSSNFSRNDEKIRILTHFSVENHSKLPIADKSLIQ